MIPPIFSREGRLSRRSFALTIGTIMGGGALAFSAGLCVLLPFAFLCASFYFRDTASSFWVIFIMGCVLLFFLVSAVMPLLAIPAAVRRLHDIGRSGWFAFPLGLLSLFTLFFPAVLLFSFLNAVLGSNSLPTPFSGNPEEDNLIFDGLFVLFLIGSLLTFLIGALCSIYIFLKKGTPGANAYGDPPAEEPLPSVRRAFLSMEGRIDRRTFAVRALLVLAASWLTLPTIVQFTLYPVTALLQSVGLLPIGADLLLLLLACVLYPLAALPLVVQRLHTLGRSSLEAVFVFAALLPSAFSCLPVAEIFGTIELIPESDIPQSVELLLAVGNTASDTAFIAFWIVCGIASLVGILRLLREDTQPGTA